MSRELLVHTALQYDGYPSIGHPTDGEDHIVGTTKEGFDCSGFIHFLLRQISFPFDENLRHASQMYDFLGYSVHHGLHLPGDLVFFTKKGLAPSHVGIVTEKKNGQTLYICSPGFYNDTIRISPLVPGPVENLDPDAIYNFNPIGYKRLAIPNGRWQIIS